MKKKKKKISLFDFCNYTFMILLILVIIYPLYFTVIASFSDPHAVATGRVHWWPVDVTLEAYEHIFTYKQLWIGYANTIYYTVFGTLFSLALTIPCAYGLSKKELPFRGFITIFFLITMYFGGGLVPGYLLVKHMGLLNTRTILIIGSGVSVYNVIVTRVYFTTGLSQALFEAAEIDGAGEFRKFFRIALPLAKPIIAVIALFYFIGNFDFCRTLE